MNLLADARAYEAALTRALLGIPLDVSSKLDTDMSDSLSRVREATEARAAAEAEWRDAIREAMDAERRTAQGYSVADVVDAAGVSRPRVYQIVSEEE